MNLFIEYLTTDMKAWELLAAYQKPEAVTPPRDAGDSNEKEVTA